MDKNITWLVAEIIQHFMFHALFYIVSLLFAGACFVLGVLIFGRRYKQRIAELERRADEREDELKRHAAEKERSEEPKKIIDSMEAIYVIGQYLEPALKGNSRAIVIHRQFLDNFEKTTGAKVGEYEYNAELLHQWMQSNAARFLIENQGDMR